MAPKSDFKAQSLLIFGATGLIGSKILDALVRAKGEFESISIFTSTATLEKKPQLIQFLKAQGIGIITGDVSNDNDVRAAYEGVDTVVSALGRDALDRQLSLIQLAASPSCSVEWFFPSEYGTDIEYSAASACEKPHQQKLKVRAALDAVKDTLAHTYVVTGPFAEGYMDRGLSDAKGGAFRVKEKQANLLGDGNGKVSLTAMADVGKYVVAALLKPELCRNRALKVNSFTTTPAEILAEFERQTGGQKWEVTYTPLNELRKLEDAAWKDGELRRATLLTLRRIWTEGGTLYDQTDNALVQGQSLETLRSTVSRVIKDEESGSV